uniref:Uncharacterized protein n=1 Tax=Anguilla anguilla TaxID=7936 RepID=A0A0E9PBY9_ANGAN
MDRILNYFVFYFQSSTAKKLNIMIH